jgi:uncharacterized protein YuzE
MRREYTRLAPDFVSLNPVTKLPREPAMKLHCYPETDSLYIELASALGAEAREIVEGLVVDLDADGNVSVLISITPRASSICPRLRRSRYRPPSRPRREAGLAVSILRIEIGLMKAVSGSPPRHDRICSGHPCLTL